MRTVYVTEWGAFEIPYDVPLHFRTDGWFDGRYRKTLEKSQAYFKKQGENIRDGKPIETYAEYQFACRKN